VPQSIPNNKPIWIGKKSYFDDEAPKFEGQPSEIRIMVCTPVHSECSIHYTQSLLKFQLACMNRRIHVAFTLLKSSLVTQGRNLCVSSFLTEEALPGKPFTHMLFIDSDIAFKSESIFRMLEADKEVIAVPYPIKNISWDKIWDRLNNKKIGDARTLSRSGFQFPLKAEKKEKLEVNKGVLEVTHAPTGCMLIKRETFEKMIKHYPEREIIQPNIINGKEENKKNMYNFFDCIHVPETKKYYGEDFGFCKLWSEMGGKIHILVTEDIVHIGEYSYTANFLDELMMLDNDLTKPKK